ncbi:carboxymuconolactone decarboxylase family protein [Thalassotalea psychrophila]|uniref:Carboxymuconolactone decarboxylase family protein n=1 Tax=Thalassotalea psychrophila TaxID=3065647 RepID=A0ABY9TPN4_9GAMM|nr:carboxymuconolactone decarboxylase family protein [Colwelliaceae bacterium SQ149]
MNIINTNTSVSNSTNKTDTSIINAVRFEQLSDDVKHEFNLVRGHLGFVPNLFSYIAHSTSMLYVFFTLSKAFENSSFTPTEREIIQLTTSKVNECNYCLAGHSYFAKLQGINHSVVVGILSGTGIENKKLSALYLLCQSMVATRGDVPSALLSDFFEQGYSRSQFIDLTMGISLKTFTNLVSKVADIEIDENFNTADLFTPKGGKSVA